MTGRRDAAPGPPTGAPGGPRLGLVLTALALGVLLAALDATMVAVALPSVAADLGDLGDASWVVTAYLLTATSSTLLYGRISDVYGRRRTLLAAVAIFLAGSALCALARDIGELAAARAVQGLGGGGLLALAFAVIADLVPDRRRARYHALFGAVFGVAGLLGPLVGGIVVDHLSWRWLFVVNLPLGAVVLAVVTTRLQLPVRRRDEPLDVPGAVLLAATIGLFLCWLARSQQEGFGELLSWAPGVLAAVTLPAFLAVQRRAAYPVLPPGLFGNRAFSLASAVAFLIGAAMFATVLFVPLAMQVGQQRSATTAGLTLLAMMTGLVASSTVAGRLISRSGRTRTYPILGTALVALGLLTLTRLDASTGTAAILAALVVVGLGFGLVHQVLVLIAQNAVPRSELGVATATVSFFRNLGGTVGTAACAALLGTVLTDRAGGEALSRFEVNADVQRLAVLPDAVAALPPGAQAVFVGAFTDATAAVFALGALCAGLAFVLALLTPAGTLAAAEDQSADQYASPRSTSADAPTSPAS